MKKKATTLAVILVLSVLLSTPAYALQEATTCVPRLTFEGTTAYCDVIVSSPSNKISVTVQLWQDNTLVTSWPASATSILSFSETYPVVKGQTYTLKVTGTIAGIPFTGPEVSGVC